VLLEVLLWPCDWLVHPSTSTSGTTGTSTSSTIGTTGTSSTTPLHDALCS